MQIELQKIYFSATHEGSVQIINPWLFRETIYGPGEWKAKCVVKHRNTQTGQNLDPKTAPSWSRLGVIHVNKAVKSKKKNMAIQPDL